MAPFFYDSNIPAQPLGLRSFWAGEQSSEQLIPLALASGSLCFFYLKGRK